MAVEIKIPALGESISEVVIAKWFKKTGDYVAMDELLCEIETDKATQELNAEMAGIITIIASEGETLPIGAHICSIEASDKPASTAQDAKATSTVGSVVASGSTRENTSYAAGHASPAAAKILAEKGIEPSSVTGSGVGGRLTKADALNASHPKPSSPNIQPKEEAQSALTTSAGDRGQKRERMSQLRKTVAKRLVAVKNETAMLTTFNEVDMKPIMDLRAKYKDKFKEKHQVGLGFMSFFVKACTTALQEFPAVNAMIDGDEILYNNYCDLSIAVSTPKGLMVPVLRNAEQLSLANIEKGIAALALKARDGKLTLEDMTGGTFTITNGGVFGSMLSTPIINAPQSAILGMHNIVERPVAIKGEVVIRPIMYVALSYDHRIIDGKESVSFLYKVKELLEDPARLLLGI